MRSQCGGILTVTEWLRNMPGIVCISYLKPKQLVLPCRAQGLSLFFLIFCSDRYLLDPLPGCTALLIHFKPPRGLISNLQSALHERAGGKSWSRGKVLKKCPFSCSPAQPFLHQASSEMPSGRDALCCLQRAQGHEWT